MMSMLLRQTSQWSPLAAFSVCIAVKSQRTKTGFLSNLCTRRAPKPLQTLLVFYPQPQTRAVLKQKPSKGRYMQAHQVLIAGSIVTAPSINGSVLVASGDPVLSDHTAC